MRYTEITEGSMGRRYGETRRRPMNLKEAFEFIRDNCSSAWHVEPIYRGAKNQKVGDGPMFVDTTSASTRLSANTKSYVGILMDNLPNWSEYPKRSKSLICTDDPSYAANYGHLYRVFPINGTKIGICQDNDLWYSFGFRSVPNFNTALDMLAEKFLNKPLSEEPSAFFNQMDEITKQIDLAGGFGSLTDYNVFKYIVSKSKELGTNDMVTILSNLVDPDRNGFQIEPIENFTSTSSRAHEVWLEGQAVLVPMALLRSLEAFMKA